MANGIFPQIVANTDGKRFCLGIDPHKELLALWGLKDDINGLKAFSHTILEIFDPKYCVAIKPQIAFFERHGSKGLAVLENILETAKQNGIPIIMDAKRSDIGSTMRGYAESYLEGNSPLAADALTVSPYMGVETLNEIANFARENGRGLFVLCLTSNPEAKDIQLAMREDGRTVAKSVFDWAYNFNQQGAPTVGLVVGATISDRAIRANIDLSAFNAPMLAPGVGTQGGNKASLNAIFGAGMPQVLPNISRNILKLGPSKEAMQIGLQSSFEDLAN